MCEVLAPGLAVSVLKAIFQEVHVQVSNVISFLLSLFSLCAWGQPACFRTEHLQQQCSVAHPAAAVLLQSSHSAEREAEIPAWPLSSPVSALGGLFPFFRSLGSV